VDELRRIEIDNYHELKLANLVATQFEISEFNSLPISNLPKIIFTDFDGCLTNDTVKINSFGREKVVVNRKDGLAVKRLSKLGIEVVIVSAETNDVVLHRAKKMKVEALRGVEVKVNTISQYLDKRAISWSEVWYLGNDINDLGAMSKAQISFCPLDASPEIFSQAKVVLSRRGGEGLLAEIASRLEKI
jgi:N-acylneuraminate cytidylyltransferase